ncbi:darcynin family protein [Emticicia fontis]
METKKPYTILVLMNATPQWLSLARDQRSEFFKKQVMPIFQKVGQAVEVKLFDSEYFHAKVSDFMIISTGNLDQYKLLIEFLRDSKIYGVPYFEVIDIIIGQENLFEDFNEVLRRN